MILLAGLLKTAPLQASIPYLSAGPMFEYNFYGQPGIFLECFTPEILDEHLQIRLQYTTSRLSFWHGKYALSVDDGYLTTSWHFRPSTMIDPYAGIDLGATHFKDRELPELKNNSMRLNLRTGALFSCYGGKLRPFIDGGYVVLTSSTTFLFFFACGVGYDFLKGGDR